LQAAEPATATLSQPLTQRHAFITNRHLAIRPIGANIYTMSLTTRQADILDFLQRHQATQGMPPTLHEIAAAFDIRHVNAVVKHLRALESKGRIALLPNRARGIRLLGATPAARHDVLHLPLIGRVAAGQPIVSEAQVERSLQLDATLFRLRPDYLLRVQGNSMRDDGILDGDLIGVHATPVAEHGQTVVARVGDHGFTVKRLYRKDGQLRLLPRNPEHAPIDPDPSDDFAIEGLFAGLIRPA
jgi:repressor LexA